jgi:predicted acyl esterase
LPAQRSHVGIGYAEARYTAVPGQVTAVLAARLWDVRPDGTELLVSRGVYRFDFNGYDAATGSVRVPLYGNHWVLPRGDRVRLDLVQVDQPTYRPVNAAVAGTLQLSGIRLTLPVREGGQTTVN